MKDILITLLSSVVFSSLISGIVSLIVVKQEAVNHLKNNRQTKRMDLSLEIFSELQKTLKEIDKNINDENLSDHSKENTFEDDLVSSIIIMQKRADEKLKEIKILIDQISYLIPKNDVLEFQERIHNIELLKYSLMAFSYKHMGNDNLIIKGVDNSINSDNFVEKVKQYIDDVQSLIDEFKLKTISILRDLCGT